MLISPCVYACVHYHNRAELRTPTASTSEDVQERHSVHNLVVVVGGPQGVAYNVSTQYSSDGSGLQIDIAPLSDVSDGCCIV